MKKIKYKFFWLSLLILFVAVFTPFGPGKGGPSYDKLAHVILFTFVSLASSFYFFKDSKQLALVFGLISTLPFLTEFIQQFIPGRNYDNYDILADYAGLILGFVVFVVFKKQVIYLFKLVGEEYIPNPRDSNHHQ